MPELSPAQAESHTTPRREKQGGLRSDPYPDTTIQKPWTKIPSALFSATMNSASSSTMSDDSELPTPNPKIRNLPDGAIQVVVGDFKAIVSSMHLVEDKVVRLSDYWRKAHQAHRS